MIELPETYVLAKQINETLVGKTIRSAAADTKHHGFAWYSGEPGEYNAKLAGKKITGANPGTGYTCGGNTEVLCDDMLLVLSTPIKYHAARDKLPKSHQLLLEFDDGSHMSCTVQMWGAMFCFPASEDGIPEGYAVKKAPTPYEDAFDRAYFDGLMRDMKPKTSAKAFLATEQRIPGFGNGVLQDVLWNARIHPKRRLETLSEEELDALFDSVKTTLAQMRGNGGRDTERDLFGNPGGYRTVLSSKTVAYPCPACGGSLKREAYLGGNIYFCEGCQVL
jgi:formamidopyrimidine-DNA glycosylase